MKCINVCLHNVFLFQSWITNRTLAWSLWMWHRVALGRYFSHRLRVHNKQRVGLATIAFILNAQQFFNFQEFVSNLDFSFRFRTSWYTPADIDSDSELWPLTVISPHIFRFQRSIRNCNRVYDKFLIQIWICGHWQQFHLIYCLCSMLLL